MTTFEKAQAIASGEIDPNATLSNEQTAQMLASLQKTAKIDPDFLASGLSLGEWTARRRTCLCKYTVAELVESLKGRTLCGSVTTNAGDTTNWGFAQEGKAD